MSGTPFERVAISERQWPADEPTLAISLSGLLPPRPSLCLFHGRKKTRGPIITATSPRCEISLWSFSLRGKQEEEEEQEEKAMGPFYLLSSRPRARLRSQVLLSRPRDAMNIGIFRNGHSHSLARERAYTTTRENVRASERGVGILRECPSPFVPFRGLHYAGAGVSRRHLPRPSSSSSAPSSSSSSLAAFLIMRIQGWISR